MVVRSQNTQTKTAKMKLIQVLSVLCVVSIGHCMSHHVDTPLLSQVHQVFHNQIGLGNENCACFGKTSPTFPESLGYTGKDWERLVVYFYKNHLSNEVQMYVPHLQNQFLFPDLSINGGDLFFNVGNVSVLEILSINPNFTILNVVTNNEPSNLNENMIDLRLIVNSDPVPNMDLHLLPDGDNLVDNISVNNWNPYSITDVKNVVDNIVPYNWNLNSIDTVPNVDNIPVTYAEPFVVEPIINENIPATDWNPNPIKLDSTIVGNIPVTDWNLELLKDTVNVVDNVLTSWDLNPLTFDINVDDSVTHWDSFVPGELHTGPIPNNPLQWNSEFISEVPEKHTHGPHSGNTHLKSHINEYKTFDDWFDQQIRMFSLLTQSSYIDIPSLKLFIQKTLSKNHIYISTTGILVDAEGKGLDLSNLKLRPILIGDSVSYNDIPYTQGSQYILPNDLPYLEAILVTLVYPPKVLGAIPIGKTYVPRSPYKNELYYLSSSNKFGCSNGPCSSQPDKKMKKVKTTKSKESKTSYDIQLPKLNSKMHGIPFGNLGSSLNLNTEIHESVPHHEEHNNILDTQFLLGPKSKNVNTYSRKFGVPNWLESTNIFNLPHLYWDEEDNVEDLPGFRIIGGNAATSSGTPVSSRGRSGFGPHK